MSGRYPVHIVGAGPGDPELMTVKSVRLLQEADVVVYAGSLLSPEVLALLRPETERYDSAVMVLEDIVDVMVRAASSGRRVVRLASGDPGLFGALGEMARPLIEAGLEVEVVPGVSSFLAAAAALGRELTVPEVSQTVVLTRAEGRTPMPPTERLAELARHQATLALFLSANLAKQVQADLLAAYPPDTPVAVVYRASWPDERIVIVSGALADLAALIRGAGITKTALIFVGRFLTAEGTRSRLYDAAFSHGYRQASKEPA
ncbi:MAG: precorrin-4 C(11)-methyltransferase [Nitrospirae bacterium]|nr:precorrin-4 C(11)-methyltransferase [Nitrospirota bacterium]